MSYTIAITGKGGTGKTTISSLLIRQLLEKNIRPVLAVDADPNSTLAPLVGLAQGPTLSDIRDEIMARKAEVSGIPKERVVDQRVGECLLEAAGFDLLTMGRPEGPSCYCYVNNLLRRALVLLKANYRVTVVDNEAGMEHLSRMNTEVIDCLVTVAEATMVSARTVARILELTQALTVKVHRRVLVWNKVPPEGVLPEAQALVAATAFDQVLVLPQDPGIERLSAAEASALAAPMPPAFAGLLEACMTNYATVLT